MRSLLLTLVLCATSTVYSWNFSWYELHRAFSKETPSWMERQIRKDLEPFAENGVTARQVEATLKRIAAVQGAEVSQLVKIRIKNGGVRWSSPFTIQEGAKKRIEAFLSALEIILGAGNLPDMDFLLSLADRYDRPVFLRETDVPVFTICKDRSNNRAVLIPRGLWEPERSEVIKDVLRASDETSWSKRKEIAFWRGVMSGGHYPHTEWDFKPRSRLAFCGKHFPDFVNASFIVDEHSKKLHSSWQSYLNMNGLMGTFTLPKDQVCYRYLVAIDGDGAASSLQWQLFSGSTLLKVQSPRLEWFYEGLVANEHYIPVREDSTDLPALVQWLRENDHEARRIAENARLLAEERLQDDAIFIYAYKLLEAYAALYPEHVSKIGFQLRRHPEL
jgi:hypothetical protein